MAFYETLLKEDLGLSDQLLESESYKNKIHEYLHPAALKLGAGNSNAAINHMLQLGSMVVLRQSGGIDKALGKIRKTGFPDGTGETTVLTIAAVHHILDWVQATNPDSQEAKDAQQIRTLFAAKDWLVGKQAMQLLEFPAQPHISSPESGAQGPALGKEIEELLRRGARRPGGREFKPGNSPPN